MIPICVLINIIFCVVLVKLFTALSWISIWDNSGIAGLSLIVLTLVLEMVIIINK